MNLKKEIKKNRLWIILVMVILTAVSIIKEPVFFDSFGLPLFLFVFLSSGYMILNKKYPEWILYTYLIISGSGLIVDGIQILK